MGGAAACDKSKYDRTDREVWHRERWRGRFTYHMQLVQAAARESPEPPGGVKMGYQSLPIGD